jgi:hypothetical protein
MGLYFLGMAFGMLSGFFFGSAYELWRRRPSFPTAKKKERWSTLLMPPQQK